MSRAVCAIGMFESSVNSYDSQTEWLTSAALPTFESSVNSYDSQTG